MRNTKASYRILALFTVFSFLPLLFSISNEKTDTYHLKQETGFSISAFNSALPLSAVSEEILHKNSVKLSRFQSYKKLEPPSKFNYWFGGRLFLFIAAYILFTTVSIFHKGNTYTRRYLIKYIHDKDGHKV